MVTVVDKVLYHVYCKDCSLNLQYEEEDKHYVSFSDNPNLIKVYYIICPKCGRRIYKA